MNTASKLIIFIFTLLTLTASAYAHAQQSPAPIVIRALTMEESGDKDMARGRYESALWSYSMWGGYSDLGSYENDPNMQEMQAYRERLTGKMIAALAKMSKPPAIPETAEFRARKGAAFVKLAKTPADYAKAVKEFEWAASMAPWVFDYRFNLAVAYKLAEQFKAALNSLKLAKLLAQSDKDRRDINGLRAEIEAAQEMAAE